MLTKLSINVPFRIEVASGSQTENGTFWKAVHYIEGPVVHQIRDLIVILITTQCAHPI